LIRVPESFCQKDRGGESKKKFKTIFRLEGQRRPVWKLLQKKFRPILFLGLWDHFELYAIIVKKNWHLHAFHSSFVQFSEISKKFLEPIQIFHLADRFETLSILVIFA
jgi:hypothetical protein